MTYTVKSTRPPRVTTYPGLGPGGADKRYIVGPIEPARAILKTMLDGNPGAKLSWEKVDYRLDEASFCVELPAERSA